jgi:hypothetical protein
MLKSRDVCCFPLRSMNVLLYGRMAYARTLQVLRMLHVCRKNFSNILFPILKIIFYICIAIVSLQKPWVFEAQKSVKINEIWLFAKRG